MKPTTKAPAKAAPAKPATKAPEKPASKAPEKTSTKPAVKTDKKAPVKKDDNKPAPIEETKTEQKVFEQPKPVLKPVSEKDLASLMEEFRAIPLNKLDSYLNAAALNGKYVLLFDKTGKVQDFMNYKATLKDFYKEVVNVRLGLKEKVDSMEELRRGLVNAMRLGGNLAINLDKLLDVNFAEEWTMDTYFPLMVFNYEDWRQDDNYMSVVRPEENHGFQDEPHFSMHEKFNMVILCLYESD